MKSAGSWPSLLQGVSQQLPEVRFPGQHGEQINMIPDPIKGLARRQGSRLNGETNLGLAAASLSSYRNDTANWTSFDYSNAGVDYTVLYRKAARASGASALSCMLVYNRTNKVWVPYTRGTDSVLDTVESGGISSITSIGKYVYFSGNTVTALQTTNDAWGNATNQGRTVVWVKAGAYNRKYEIEVTRTDGAQFTFSYTTPSSAYDVLLDTSSVPVFMADPAGGTQSDTEAALVRHVGAFYQHELMFYAWTPTSLTAKKAGVAMTNVSPAAPANSTEFSWATGDRYVRYHSSNLSAVDLSVTYTHVKAITNPNYARMINELTNEYNQAVNAWIKSAAEAVEPAAIAEKLRLAAVAAGVGGTIAADGPYLTFTNVKGVTADDGGDDTLMLGCAAEVTAIERVSAKHFVGKVVRVRARNAEESFYMKALATDPTVTSGLTNVTWVEGAGVEQTVSRGICMATIDAGVFKVASSATLLTALGVTGVPDYVTSNAGDSDSNPPPFFVNRKITYLGVFQDRLLVGCGGVIRASRTGDYLNFYRTTVLTAPTDESVEFLSESSESDDLRYSVLYDQSLVLFGRKKQYIIDAKTTLGPTSANLPAMSSHSDAAELAPVAAGNIIFYAKKGALFSSIHQIEPGPNPNSPESYPASSQIDDYLTGKAIDLCVMPKPSTLFVRTSGARYTLFVFSYTDRQDGRKQDAWHRWNFDSALGPIIGMSPTSDGIMIYTLRVVGANIWVVADLLALTSDLSTTGYLDSIRTLQQVQAGTGSVTTSTGGDWKVVIDSGSPYQFLGEELDNLADFLADYPVSDDHMDVGIAMPASVKVTNPFIRDKNDVAITTGELVVSTIKVTLKESSGYTVTVESDDETFVREHNGRIIGDPNNIVGREVITNLNELEGVGREVREYEFTLAARTWLPMTISRLEWVGQYFNNVRRIGG